jgi:hypothetical protein
MTNIEIANIILEQIGGPKMAKMTGAKNFTAINNGLQFKLPSNFARDGINCVRVVLEPSDTYTVSFLKVRGTSYKEVSSFDETYCDQLRGLFEEVTGLRTSLTAVYA